MRHNRNEYSWVRVSRLILKRPGLKRWKDGGTTKGLLDRLNLDSVDRLQSTLRFLLDSKLIEPGERVFMITADGVDYVADHQVRSEPPDEPPGPSDPPWSPGDPGGRRPPEINPDDPSCVPRRPKPTG